MIKITDCFFYMLVALDLKMEESTPALKIFKSKIRKKKHASLAVQEEDLVDVPYGFIINYNKEMIKIKHEEV